MKEQLDGVLLLQHTLKTIQCRMNAVILDASPEFGGFSTGSRARTPVEILGHVADVLSFAIEEVAPGSFSFERGERDWPHHARRYQAALYGLDRALSTPSLPMRLAYRVLQGPIADVLTHVGQLAMLRGLAGQPVPGQMFFALDLPDVAPAGAG